MAWERRPAAIATDAEKSVGGNIYLTGKDIQLTHNVGAMVPLRESFMRADAILPERCETRDPEQAGSFVVDESDGFPPRPDELLW